MIDDSCHVRHRVGIKVREIPPASSDRTIDLNRRASQPDSLFPHVVDFKSTTAYKQLTVTLTYEYQKGERRGDKFGRDRKG